MEVAIPWDLLWLEWWTQEETNFLIRTWALHFDFVLGHTKHAVSLVIVIDCNTWNKIGI